MKRLILAVGLIFFIGCSGHKKHKSSTTVYNGVVKGVAYDGILYNATVKVYDQNHHLIGSGKTSSNPDDLGSFVINFKTKKAPKMYYLEISGGSDTGADDIKNENDYNSSLVLTSVKDKTSFIAITPATTLVSNLVSKGYSLNEAKKRVNEALGVSENVDLLSLNPKENLLAKKAAKAVVLIAKVLPGDENKNFKLLSDVIKNKALVKLNSVNPVEFNITQVLKNEKNATVVQNYVKNENIIKNQINTFLNAVDTNDKAEMESSFVVIDTLKRVLEGNSTYSSDDVLVFKNRLKEVLNRLNELNISYNLNEVKEIVKNDLDVNTSLLVDKIINLYKVSKISDENRKLLYEALLKTDPSIDVHRLDGFDLSALDIENVPFYTKELYYELIAVVLANNFNNLNLADVFYSVEEGIVYNYNLQNLLNQISSSKTDKIIFSIVKEYFYKNSTSLSEDTFNNTVYNNLLDLRDYEIKPFVSKIDNEKKLAVFESVIKYVDLTNATEDFNNRIIPLYNLLIKSLQRSDIAFFASLQKFESVYKTALLNKQNISQSDINTILVKTEPDEVKPVMFPNLVSF